MILKLIHFFLSLTKEKNIAGRRINKNFSKKEWNQ